MSKYTEIECAEFSYGDAVTSILQAHDLALGGYYSIPSQLRLSTALILLQHVASVNSCVASNIKSLLNRNLGVLAESSMVKAVWNGDTSYNQ